MVQLAIIYKDIGNHDDADKLYKECLEYDVWIHPTLHQSYAREVEKIA